MTVSQFEPSVPDIETLQRTNAKVGCNGNSFIVRYLTNMLNFKPENTVKVKSMVDYEEAFNRGDIAAAFFVVAHAKVFLAKFCKAYTTTGPTQARRFWLCNFLSSIFSFGQITPFFPLSIVQL